MSPDQRRAALIEATLPLLREHGPAVSTKEIASAAGVAEGTIFRVFGTKDELVAACVQHAFDSEDLRAALREVDRTLPLQERLTVAVDLLQAHLRGVFSLMITLRTGGQAAVHRPSDAAAHAAHAERRQRDSERIDAELVQLVGQDADSLRVPVQRLLDFLRMLTLASVHPFMQRSPASAGEIVDVALNGLATASRKSKGN
jgi:AcrR family transcriptional regulator